MVSPEHFRVSYAINPYMTDSEGALHKVDAPQARLQWEGLRTAYESLGYRTEVLPGVPELPDMVFAANQSFPFWDYEAQKPAVVLSRMRSPFRAGEVAHFEAWYRGQGYRVVPPGPHGFEGCGDALPDPELRLIWGGYGPRTDRAAYEWLSGVTGDAVVPLELVHPDFYHLDTCFSFVGDTVAFLPDAFSDEGRAAIRSRFPNAIELDLAECRRDFAGNCHWPGGKSVLLHGGAPRLVAALKDRQLRPVFTPTGEFLKSGGSVFCMKMMCF